MCKVQGGKAQKSGEWKNIKGLVVVWWLYTSGIFSCYSLVCNSHFTPQDWNLFSELNWWTTVWSVKSSPNFFFNYKHLGLQGLLWLGLHFWMPCLQKANPSLIFGSNELVRHIQGFGVAWSHGSFGSFTLNNRSSCHFIIFSNSGFSHLWYGPQNGKVKDSFHCVCQINLIQTIEG